MKKLLATLFIAVLFVGIIGCGDQKAAKVKEFNDYVKLEEKTMKKFEDDFNLVNKKMESAQSLDDLSKSFKEGQTLFTDATNKLKGLKAPSELQPYKDKELAMLNELITSFDNLNQAISKQDVTQMESEAKKMEKLDTEMENGKELDNLLKEAAKKAGIQVEFQGEKFIFKK